MIKISLVKDNFWKTIYDLSSFFYNNKKNIIEFIFDDTITKEQVLKVCFELAEYYYYALEILLMQNNKIVVSFKVVKSNDNKEWSKNSSTEKYGTKSDFFKISKLIDPYFSNDLRFALKNVNNQDKILILGINKGEELDFIENLYPNYKLHIMGVDFSESIILYLRNKYKGKLNYNFFKMDINFLSQSKLSVEKFNIILAIGTLQSSSIETKRVFMELIQNNLYHNGQIIIGNPNCRYINRDPYYGAKIKNFQERDLSLLIKDIYFYKKYLQQHQYKVRIFGKNYIFLQGKKNI